MYHRTYFPESYFTPRYFPKVGAAAAGPRFITRTLFALNGNDLTANPTLAPALRAAGFNAISQGFFINPAINGSPTFAAWKAGYDGWFDALWHPVRDAGFKWTATGDDLARNVTALNGSLNGYGPQAVQYAVGRLAATGICDRIEMVDESNVLWPGGPDPGMTTLVDMMRAVPGCPPLAWTLDAGVHVTAASFVPWCDPTICDALTVYSPAQVWYIPDLPLQAFSLAKNCQAEISGMALLPPAAGRPIATLIPFTGEYGQGPNLLVGAFIPEAVVAVAWLALALGVTSLRYYSWDLDAWAAGRVAPGPTQDWSTGTTPTVGPARWAAATASNGLIARMETRLIGETAVAPDWGTPWVTGRRTGSAGEILWGINTSNAAAAVPSNVGALYGNAALLTATGGAVDTTPALLSGSSVPSGGVAVFWETPVVVPVVTPGKGSKVGGWARSLVAHLLVEERERSVLARTARENAFQFRAALLRASLVEETRVAQAKSYLEGTMYSVLLAEL